MALVTKNDIKQIFADQAPSIDKPASFANYPRGWDASRPNNGKPTIKQSNYLQQRTDQNFLWIHQNGAALPYDAAMEYAEGAVVVKDGELQQYTSSSWVSIGSDSATVQSIADLRQLTPKNKGQIVNLVSVNPDQNEGGGAFIATQKAGLVDDGGLIVASPDPLLFWVRVTRNKLNPRNFGVVGDGVTDDSDAIDQLLEYMRSIAKVDNRGFNLQGRGVDFSGLTCLVSRPISLLGFSNYTFISPAFTAAPNFAGDSLLLIGKYTAGQWQINNIAFVNPYFDCNWVCDYAVNMTDYVKVKIFGGYIYRYRKKGIRSVKGAANCHELNLVGTFIFQTEAGEDYPSDITEGEAYYIDSPDNNFSNVIIGPQKVAVGTATGGPAHFSNCHFYAGGLKKIYGSTSDHFVGCYFDGVELVLGDRSTVIGNLFVVNEGGFALTFPKDNFSIRVQANQFKKLGSNVNIFNYPTLAERTSAFIPFVRDNYFDNTPTFQTSGRVWITGANATQTSYTLPDSFRPLGSHNFGSWTNLAGNSGSGTVFITTELSSAQDTIIIRAYKLNASGALIAQNMSGMSFYLNLNS